jgi:chorismate mutase
VTSEEAAQRLASYRAGIDEIDRGIVRLLNERTIIVEQIGRIKREMSMSVYEPKREDDVFRNVTENNQGPMPGDSLKRVFERIIDEMRTLQRNRVMEEKRASVEPRP